VFISLCVKSSLHFYCIELIVPAYGILISMTVELLLITCIQYSGICCEKIANFGGLYLMVNQIKEEAQRENYNKVRNLYIIAKFSVTSI